MLTNNNGSPRSWMRKALALPVVAAAVLVFSCSKQQPGQIALARSATGAKTDSILMIHIKYLPSSLKLVLGKNGNQIAVSQDLKDTLMEVHIVPRESVNLITVKD
jgi:hypothetical protein